MSELCWLSCFNASQSTCLEEVLDKDLVRQVVSACLNNILQGRIYAGLVWEWVYLVGWGLAKLWHFDRRMSKLCKKSATKSIDGNLKIKLYILPYN